MTYVQDAMTHAVRQDKLQGSKCVLLSMLLLALVVLMDTPTHSRLVQHPHAGLRV